MLYLFYDALFIIISLRYTNGYSLHSYEEVKYKLKSENIKHSWEEYKEQSVMIRLAISFMHYIILSRHTNIGVETFQWCLWCRPGKVISRIDRKFLHSFINKVYFFKTELGKVHRFNLVMIGTLSVTCTCGKTFILFINAKFWILIFENS